MYIENVVIGKPTCSPQSMFCAMENENEDWIQNEQLKTCFTEERFLPAILVFLGFAKSNSEVKRNWPKLFVQLDHLDFLELKLGKKKLWILVGE